MKTRIPCNSIVDDCKFLPIQLQTHQPLKDYYITLIQHIPPSAFPLDDTMISTSPTGMLKCSVTPLPV
jgi:hypothetical protein